MSHDDPGTTASATRLESGESGGTPRGPSDLDAQAVRAAVFRDLFPQRFDRVLLGRYTLLQKLGEGFNAREQALTGQDVMNSLAALPMPTIAAINGFALGGGLELSLACDLRVASPQAKLGLPEVGLGIIPGYGGTQRLSRLIGMGRAMDIIMTGRHVAAEEALGLGLVNRVEEDPLASSLALAEQCLKNGPVALGLAKEAVVRGADLTLSQGLEVEADLFAFACTTQDAQEGMRAFLEKRAAEFQGR